MSVTKPCQHNILDRVRLFLQSRDVACQRNALINALSVKIFCASKKNPSYLDIVNLPHKIIGRLKMFKREKLLLMTYMGKTLFLGVPPPGNTCTIALKNINDLSKKETNIS